MEEYVENKVKRKVDDMIWVVKNLLNNKKECPKGFEAIL
jgi:hypothetical protein